MSAKLINQTGILNMQYQIKIQSKPNHVSVNLHGKLAGAEESIYLDSVTGTGKKPLYEAMLKAEIKWGIDLVKYSPEILNK